MFREMFTSTLVNLGPISQLSDCVGRALLGASSAVVEGARVAYRHKLKVIAACTITATVACKVSIVVSDMGGVSGLTRSIFTGLVDSGVFSTRSENQAERKAFRQVIYENLAVNPAHSHGALASDRAAFLRFADSFAEALGRTAYHYQMSAQDQRQGRVGSRSYFWAKDLAAEGRMYRPQRDDEILVITDTDYYLDINDILVKATTPVLLYTVIPTAVGVTGQQSFTFKEDGSIEMLISGGGRYCHHLWNHNHDVVLAVRRLMGVPISAVAYNVERRTGNAEHRGVVLYSPVMRFTTFGALLATYLIENRVERLNPVVEGGFTRLDVVTRQGIFRSIGRVGDFTSITIPVEDDEKIAALARVAAKDLTVTQVKSQLQIADNGLAALLTEYHRRWLRVPSQRAPYVVEVEDAINHYEYASTTGPDEEAKPSGVAIANPIATNMTYMPMACVGNNQEAVRRRVIDIRSDAQITPLIEILAEKFARMLFPKPLQPVLVEDVYDKQNRPTQQTILEHSDLQDDERKVDSFMKRETYGTVKPPRVISTINGTDKTEYSQYMYAVSEALKETTWYAFGKTPIELANRVAEVLNNHSVDGMYIERPDFVYETDLSRMDGRISPCMRAVERIILQHAFPGDEQVLELHAAQYNLIGHMRGDVHYDTGTSRASGSPETSVLNTIDNAFMAFLAALDPEYFTTESAVPPFVSAQTCRIAYRKLAIYGGDDGISRGCPEEHYVRVCEMLGQKLTINRVNRGERVTFLARIFSPYAWYGATDSCCDLTRQVPKIHVSNSVVLNVERKFIEKMISFAMTDRHTPIMAQIIEALQNLGLVEPEPVLVFDPNSMNWFSQYDASVQFPNENIGNWMDDYLEAALPGFDLDLLEKHCHEAQTMEQLMRFPVCFEAPEQEHSDPSLLINGENPVGAVPTVTDPLPPVKPKHKSTAMCRQCGAKGHVKANCTATPKERTPGHRPSQGNPKNPKATGAPPQEDKATKTNGGSKTEAKRDTSASDKGNPLRKHKRNAPKVSGQQQPDIKSKPATKATKGPKL